MREFLFTDEEVEADWKKYQEIVDLKKILRPNTILATRTLNTKAFSFLEAGEDPNNQSLSKIVK